MLKFLSELLGIPMWKFLGNLFLDIVTDENHDPVPQNLFRTLEVKGKVLRFRVLRQDSNIAFPDEKRDQQYINTHSGRPPEYVAQWLPDLEKLTDEELALQHGLMRCNDSFYGYTQPFIWAAQGIIKTSTWEVEPHTSETDRRLRPGSRC